MNSSEENERKIKHILVAVDGSENAARAVEIASKIAKTNDAELTILHVISFQSAMYYAAGPTQIDRLEEEARRNAERYVGSALSIAEKFRVKAVTEIIEHMDSVVMGIVEYSEREHVDLIVVGTRGLGGFKRLILGSVASGVVHYAHCSVLVVR
ncbi:MAG: universal stress protein [Conexivisphaerales archaeon]